MALKTLVYSSQRPLVPRHGRSLAHMPSVDGFIATEDRDWEVPYKLSFDVIINTLSSNSGFDMAKYLSLMDVYGRFISFGLPEDS